MKLVNLLIGVFGLLLLVSCGGGGSGSNRHKRTYQISYQQNTAQNARDSSGIDVILNTNALVAPSVTPVSLSFTESWPDKPASPVIETRTVVLCETTAEPGTGTIVVRYPYTQTDPDELQGVASEDGMWWRPLQTVVERANQRVTVSYTYASQRDSRQSDTRDLKRLIRIGITRVPYKSQTISAQMKLVRLHGNGLDDHIDSSDSCVLVHGMNNTVDDMRALGEALYNKQTFKHVYALQYDWRKPIKVNGQQAATLLRQQLKPGAKTTLIGYSLGGLVTSWMVERELTHDLLRGHVMIGTPRQGTKIADEQLRCEGQKEDSLNDAQDTIAHWGNLCDLAVPSAKDVIPGSPFLNELNGNAINHRTSIPYGLVAGDKGTWGYAAGEFLCRKHYGGGSCDGLVPASSLLDYPYEQHEIHGAVVRRTLHYNHAQLVKSKGAVAAIAEEIKTLLATPAPKLAITASDIKARDNGWIISYTLENQGVIPLTTNALCLPTFDAYGEWTTTQWHIDALSHGDYFPTSYTSWKKTLMPGQAFTYAGRVAFDFSDNSYIATDVRNRAKTILVVCTGEWSNNHPFTATTSIALADKNGKVAQPPRRGATLMQERGKPIISVIR